MQAVHGLLARLFTKSSDENRNKILSPTESEKQIINVDQNVETPAGLNDGPILREMSSNLLDSDSDSSLEILEVRSFDSEDERKILENNHEDLRPFNLLEAIHDAVVEKSPEFKNELVNGKSRKISVVDKMFEDFQRESKMSLPVNVTQPHNLDSNRESQHEKVDDDEEEDVNSEMSDSENAIIEFRNETQVFIQGDGEEQQQEEEYDNGMLDFDMIDKIEESLINKRLLQPVQQTEEPVEKSVERATTFERIMNEQKNQRNQKVVTFEEENITSEDEILQISDSDEEVPLVPVEMEEQEEEMQPEVSNVVENQEELQPEVSNVVENQEELQPEVPNVVGNQEEIPTRESDDEDEPVALTKKDKPTKIQESDDNDEPSKTMLDLIGEVGPAVLTPAPTANNQMNIEVDQKQAQEVLLSSQKFDIGQQPSIDEPSQFALQKAQTPYLNNDEINAVLEGEDTKTDLKRKANEVEEESQEKTEDLYSNPLLNGFFSQKKNTLKKRKVYIASEIKLLDASLFTKEEDDLIIEYVRRNPHLKSSHTLYEHIAKSMKKHTGNSIRRRFFNKLENKVDYYYEVDEETGELAQDSKGNPIQNRNAPTTQKNKFTAEEDYCMALLLKCHFYLTLNPDVEGIIDRYDIDALDKVEKEYYEKNLIPDDMNKLTDRNIVPSNPDIPCANNGKVIDWKPDFAQFRCNGTNGPLRKEIVDRISMRFSTHSQKSWRDRYNKMLKPYGIDRFIYYYNKCRILKIEPEPIAGLSSALNRAKLLHSSVHFPENITLADLEMKFTRKRK